MWYGFNYLPKKSGVYMWKDFDENEINKDFELFSRDQFNYLRIFLIWEDFQPEPDKFNKNSFKNLKSLIRAANNNGIQLTITLFTGHLSGTNFLPDWLIFNQVSSSDYELAKPDSRFSIYSNDREYTTRKLYNFWHEEDLINYQKNFCGEVIDAVINFKNVHAIDLGNESDNIIPINNHKIITEWFHNITDYIRKNCDLKITYGLHGELLTGEKGFSIFEIARYTDFVSFHVYPHYTSWLKEKADIDFIPFMIYFLHYLTGKQVFLQEVGLPSDVNQELPVSEIVIERNISGKEKQMIFNKTEYQNFFMNTMQKSKLKENMGILFWCNSDFNPKLFDLTPYKTAKHERFFGFYDIYNQKKVTNFSLSELNEIKAGKMQKPLKTIFNDLIDLHQDYLHYKSVSEDERLVILGTTFNNFKKHLYN